MGCVSSVETADAPGRRKSKKAAGKKSKRLKKPRANNASRHDPGQRLSQATTNATTSDLLDIVSTPDDVGSSGKLKLVRPTNVVVAHSTESSSDEGAHRGSDPAAAAVRPFGAALHPAAARALNNAHSNTPHAPVSASAKRPPARVRPTGESAMVSVDGSESSGRSRGPRLSRASSAGRSSGSHRIASTVNGSSNFGNPLSAPPMAVSTADDSVAEAIALLEAGASTTTTDTPRRKSVAFEDGGSPGDGGVARRERAPVERSSDGDEVHRVPSLGWTPRPLRHAPYPGYHGHSHHHRRASSAHPIRERDEAGGQGGHGGSSAQGQGNSRSCSRSGSRAGRGSSSKSSRRSSLLTGPPPTPFVDRKMDLSKRRVMNIRSWIDASDTGDSMLGTLCSPDDDEAMAAREQLMEELILNRVPVPPSMTAAAAVARLKQSGEVGDLSYSGTGDTQASTPGTIVARTMRGDVASDGRKGTATDMATTRDRTTSESPSLSLQNHQPSSNQSPSALDTQGSPLFQQLPQVPQQPEPPQPSPEVHPALRGVEEDQPLVAIVGEGSGRRKSRNSGIPRRSSRSRH